YVYDMERFLSRDSAQGLVTRLELPEGTQPVEMNITSYKPPGRPGGRGFASYHDMFVGYDPVTHQDKFYGGGSGGFYIYDLSHVEEPKFLTSITNAAGV